GLIVAGPDAEPVLEGAHAAASAAGGSPGGEGPYAPQMTRIVHVPDAEAAAAELARVLRPGDAVLVKGPRAMGLERTAELLLGGTAQ
ncbi:MAG: UDP-N-acetylmuramoyl-tripeptide--D-alanyl-D-alanine ligase, partial [Nonomuraea sp.]|nr:UDP-N-acetylmuramoyl-tripeptide--D-alanyl-D-alanine ligase [Nonomuraea sp.]